MFIGLTMVLAEEACGESVWWLVFIVPVLPDVMAHPGSDVVAVLREYVLLSLSRAVPVVAAFVRAGGVAEVVDPVVAWLAVIGGGLVRFFAWWQAGRGERGVRAAPAWRYRAVTVFSAGL